MDLECMSGDTGGAHKGGGRAHPAGRATCPKTSRIEDRSGVPLPQASVATKNQSGPCFGTLPKGDPITDGHLHHPGAIHDEEGVVHPRG